MGSAVSCLFPGGQGALHLRGLVRWTQPDGRYGGPARSRVGIEFEPLTTHARQSLQALLSQVQRSGEIMRVHLPNFTQPLLGVAVPSERGVHLHVPLPFFVSGSVVRFEPVDGANHFEGRVLGSQLGACPETQALELDLLLEPCQPARKRRYMMYEAQEQGRSTKLARRSDDDTIPVQLRVPKTVTNRMLIGGVVLGCALWVGLALKDDLGFDEPAAHATNGAVRKRAPLPPPQPEHPAIARTQLPSRSATPAELELPRNEPPRPQPVAAAPEVPAAPVGPPPPAATEVLPASLPPAAPALIQPQAPQPRFTMTDDASELFVPITGSLIGMRTAMWVDPLALVLEMPSGTIPLEQSRYEIRGGGVVALSFGKPKGLTQLRVYLSEPVARFATNEAPGGIAIHLKHGAPQR